MLIFRFELYEKIANEHLNSQNSQSIFNLKVFFPRLDTLNVPLILSKLAAIKRDLKHIFFRDTNKPELTNQDHKNN